MKLFHLIIWLWSLGMVGTGYAQHASGVLSNGPARSVLEHLEVQGVRLVSGSASEPQQGNSDSGDPSVSADGRYVAFVSRADNLVGEDTNESPDIFVRDRQTGTTERVNVSSSGEQARKVEGGQYVTVYSRNPSISADGRYVAFDSDAYNLVSKPTYGTRQVYVHDRKTGETLLVSMAPDGTPGLNDSRNPSISADGRYIAFESDADNLVEGDTNFRTDIFVRDMQTGVIVRVSVDSDGQESDGYSSDPSISPDGTLIVFSSNATTLTDQETGGHYHIYGHHRTTGETRLLSKSSEGDIGNDDSGDPEISASGRYVAFESDASNLVAFDFNETTDVFVHDLETGQTIRVSVGFDNVEGNAQSEDPAVSADGRYVLFVSDASNLVEDDTNEYTDVFLHDRQTGETILVHHAPDGGPADDEADFGSSAISSDGRLLFFSSPASNLVDTDANGYIRDVFAYDLATRKTSIVSMSGPGPLAGNGPSTEPALSANGRFVAFASRATNIGVTYRFRKQLFLRDLVTDQIEMISITSSGAEGHGSSEDPGVSADGRYVVFESGASTLVPDDTNNQLDVFVRDRQNGTTTRVSVASDGTEGNGSSGNPSISADGRYVAFDSEADNLVADDTNGERDVFVHDLETGQTTRVSVASDGTQANDWSASPTISADGRYVFFESDATNLAPGETCFDYGGSNTCMTQIYRHDRLTGETIRVSVSSDGMAANEWAYRPAASADGRYVVFHSSAKNLVQDENDWEAVYWMNVYVRDIEGGTTALVSRTPEGVVGDSWSQNALISPDGRYVVFETRAQNLGVTNNSDNIAVHDLQTGETTIVSRSSTGEAWPGNAENASIALVSDTLWVAYEVQVTERQIFLAAVSVEANRAPSEDITVAVPADGAHIVIQGAPDDTLWVRWHAASDPDGDPLSYRWQLALDSLFQTVVLERVVGSDTLLGLTYRELADLLDGLQLDLGRFFHRVVVSDGTVEVAGSGFRITLERGQLTASETGGLPERLLVGSPYPNPTVDRAQVRLELPWQAEVCWVVYDLLGRRLRGRCEQAGAGAARVVVLETLGLAAGVYLYRLTVRRENAAAHVRSGRLVLLR